MSDNYTGNSVTLDSFIGQSKAITLLKTSIESAKLRGESLGHTLIVGERGSGKHTLAEAIAVELNASVRSTSFYAIKTASDLTAVLTNLGEGEILLIDNFDSISKDCLELLPSAMDDFSMNIVIGKGHSSRSINLQLPIFTLIALCEDLNAVPKRIRTCFSIIANLEEYSLDELVQLVNINASRMNVKVEEKAAILLAMNANGSYRVITNSIKRARDFALIKNNGIISEEIANEVVELMGSY